ncbi:hypothetical protein QC761_301177 [Podospora bellae-mahoneyi]|uniref:Uncharacterized protein n=1 Tax=Podospora bellae-mahoneyi TaxID=2093777 RepID=A0ABR0FJ95_9PEZI|nr:hypothetical protein QC761_301177 [Podospora bellae-mahoneyi]
MDSHHVDNPDSWSGLKEMVHLILLVLVSTYAYAAPQPAATDTSVTQTFVAYPREVLYQARSAAACLNDQLDFDFHNVFHAIFKASFCTQNTYRYSPEYDHTWGPTAGVPWQIVSDTMFGLGTTGAPQTTASTPTSASTATTAPDTNTRPTASSGTPSSTSTAPPATAESTPARSKPSIVAT